MAVRIPYPAVTKQDMFLLLAYRMKDQWPFFTNLQSVAEIMEKIVSLIDTPVPVFLKYKIAH